MNTNLMRESPGTPWQVHEIGSEVQNMYSDILREATHLGELQLRLAMEDVGHMERDDRERLIRGHKAGGGGGSRGVSRKHGLLCT